MKASNNKINEKVPQGGIKGYDKLTQENKNLYDNFIKNFHNAWGLDARATIRPIEINYVREIEHLGKENQEDDYYIVLKTEIHAIYNDGTTKLIHEYHKDEYKSLSTVTIETKEYLRFEYKIYDREDWLHVVNEREWY
ncbi:hypothetical protein [Vallitalea guaymasensis]|uniref:hypothetical protein n=1 Tax=Vallitalea guaymasensis TaxID=1185412 RepID=UPI0012903D2C|nr:hypothetical protein [Vallitalea guaymasensis]